MTKLFIRLMTAAVETEEGFDVQSEWLILNDAEALRAQGETDYRGLTDIVDADSGWMQSPDNVIVTVPNEYLLSIACVVPGRSSAQIRRALPYVVEEYLATDIERMHLAHGNVVAGSKIHCTLVERPLLDAWLACLHKLDVYPGQIVAESDLLPVAEDQLTLFFDGARVLIRNPDQGAAVERSNLQVVLGALPVKRLLLINGELDSLELAAVSPDTVIERISLSEVPGESALGYLAARALERPAAINLLQGNYRARKGNSSGWQRWLPGVGLAACWLLAALIINVIQAISAGTAADSLEAESVALYRDIYPEATRITNVRRQMQSAMGEGSVNFDRIGLLPKLGQVGVAVPQSSAIQSLAYTQEQGELSVDLTIAGYEELDRLKAALTTAGLNVEIASAEQQDQKVRSRIRIQDAGQGT